MHSLVVIGWAGIRRAYLDIPREEAFRRWMVEDGSEGDTQEEIPVTEFEFESEFGVYDAWEKC